MIYFTITNITNSFLENHPELLYNYCKISLPTYRSTTTPCKINSKYVISSRLCGGNHSTNVHVEIAKEK